MAPLFSHCFLQLLCLCASHSLKDTFTFTHILMTLCQVGRHVVFGPFISLSPLLLYFMTKHSVPKQQT